MKPAVTTCPVTSSSRRPGASAVPTCTTRSPAITTSRTASRPDSGSMTRPPRSTMSKLTMQPEYPNEGACCREHDGTGAVPGKCAVLVRSVVPLGVDHFPLDAGGGKGAAGPGRLADHVACLPEPHPA